MGLRLLLLLWYELIFHLTFVILTLLPGTPQLVYNCNTHLNFEKLPTQKVDILSQNMTSDMGAAA